jgi:transposase
VAYPRETQERVFDAHHRAFAFWGGVPVAGIYDNPKTRVDAVWVGKERQFNRRFLALMNHYLIEPIACTPAAGGEKGQVENQGGTLREWLFTPDARIPIAAAEQILADPPRCFGRGQSLFNPWHYLPVLERKPGALRDGAPFQP